MINQPQPAQPIAPQLFPSQAPPRKLGVIYPTATDSVTGGPATENKETGMAKLGMDPKVSFKPTVAGTKKAAKETAEFAINLPKEALKTLDPREVYKNVKTVIDPLAGEQGFIAQAFSKDTSERNAQLATLIAMMENAGKINPTRASLLLNALPQAATAGPESKGKAFAAGAKAAAGAASYASIVNEFANSPLAKKLVAELTEPDELDELVTKVLADSEKALKEAGEGSLKLKNTPYSSVEGLDPDDVVRVKGSSVYKKPNYGPGAMSKGELSKKTYRIIEDLDDELGGELPEDLFERLGKGPLPSDYKEQLLGELKAAAEAADDAGKGSKNLWDAFDEVSKSKTGANSTGVSLDGLSKTELTKLYDKHQIGVFDFSKKSARSMTKEEIIKRLNDQLDGGFGQHAKAELLKSLKKTAPKVSAAPGSGPTDMTDYLGKNPPKGKAAEGLKKAMKPAEFGDKALSDPAYAQSVVDFYGGTTKQELIEEAVRRNGMTWADAKSTSKEELFMITKGFTEKQMKRLGLSK